MMQKNMSSTISKKIIIIKLISMKVQNYLLMLKKTNDEENSWK